MFVYFTQLLGRMVVDRQGRMIGRVCDLAASFEGMYPPITGMLIANGWLRKHYSLVPWEQVQSNRYQGRTVFQLKLAADAVVWSSTVPPATETTLSRTILDEQVVDIYNRKVVRVNDIHLLEVETDYRVAHVDVGLRGIVRRLGWQPVLDRCVRACHPQARYLTHDSLIAWKYIQALTVHPVKGTIPLALAEADLHDIPPADLSEILISLDPYQRVALFKSLDAPTQGEILAELDTRYQRELLAELDLRSAVDVLERMPPDEATDVLQEMPHGEVSRLLAAVSVRTAQTLTALLPHHEDSAGGLMTTQFIRLRDQVTVGEAIEQIKAMTHVAETIYSAYVVNADGRLVGVTSFRSLLFEPNARPIRDCMDERPVSVRVTDRAKEVAFIMEKYNFLAVPVLDDADALVGIVTVDDILRYVIETAWGTKTGLL